MTAFDRLVGRAPANAQAARVTGRGENWVPETPMPPGFQHWKAQPRMRAPIFPDMTGKKFGRFTVLGVLDDDGHTKNRGTRWVVKCGCGDFEAKSTKAIRSMLTMTDMASSGFQRFFCSQWLIAKNRYQKRGSRPVSDFIRPQEKVVRKPIEEIIAARLPAAGTLPHVKLALTIISDLQNAAYRIVRHQDQKPAATTEEG
jgi:hypothetical protein